MREKNAYFTVEAAMVLPLLMGALLFGVYLLLFQYNRCLMEQDVGVLALRGSVWKGTEEELEAGLETWLEEWYEEKYVAWETDGIRAGVKYNSGYAEMQGKLYFPVPGWNFWNGKELWEEEAVSRFVRTDPVDFLRMCRKLLKGKGE